MTVNQFVKKYNIPLSLVYKASFQTDTRKNDPYYIHDVPESELAKETYVLLNKAINKYQDILNKYTAMADRVKNALE